ncbi:MAG: hypothetical protein SGARI_006121 [Bacillariaceae sp.]
MTNSQTDQPEGGGGNDASVTVPMQTNGLTYDGDDTNFSMAGNDGDSAEGDHEDTNQENEQSCDEYAQAADSRVGNSTGQAQSSGEMGTVEDLTTKLNSLLQLKARSQQTLDAFQKSDGFRNEVLNASLVAMTQTDVIDPLQAMMLRVTALVDRAS